MIPFNMNNNMKTKKKDQKLALIKNHYYIF